MASHLIDEALEVVFKLVHDEILHVILLKAIKAVPSLDVVVVEVGQTVCRKYQ